MKGLEKREYTKQNLLTLTNHKEPEKVLSYLSIETGWGLMYAGVKWADVEDDPEGYAQAYCKSWREIPIDMSFATAPTRTTVLPSQALGNYKMVYTSDGLGVVHNQAADVYLGPEVYDEILADPQGLSERFARMNNPVFLGSREEALEAAKKGVKRQVIANDTVARIAEILKDEIGMYPFHELDFGSPLAYGYVSEFWTFYDKYRGPQSALSDLRRYPDKVKKACDFLYEQTKARMVYNEEDIKQALPLGNSMFHPESYMSPKQFDELYFQRFMEILGPVMEAGKKIFLYGEGAFMRHLDRFRETPQHSMIIVIDQDDIFEASKKVGDWCTLVGGPKAELLTLGTEQQIKDYVKRCFDELAPGGGYIFALGNGLIAAKDVPVKGIVTAYETAEELSRG